MYLSIAPLMMRIFIYCRHLYFNNALVLKVMEKYLMDHTKDEAESYAKKEIKEMTVSEYISEINWWVHNSNIQ